MVGMIKAIIFDCFGVLTKDWWREFCSTLPPGEPTRLAHELNHKYDAGEISLKEFVDRVAAATGSRPEPIEDIFTTPEPEKNTVLLEYIQELKAKDYKIGMLSNVGTNWIREHFLKPDEKALFDDFVLSYEVGVTKPHSEIFEMAAQRLGLKPEEIVFTDDIESYCQAAAAVGLKTIVYQDFNQFKTELEKLLAADPDN
jgi:epoxide hydrolase-like predicted phosphatase